MVVAREAVLWWQVAPTRLYIVSWFVGDGDLWRWESVLGDFVDDVEVSEGSLKNNMNAKKTSSLVVSSIRIQERCQQR